MSVSITLHCDFPDCDRIFRTWTFTKSQLLAYARRDGWQIGKAKHYCPYHRFPRHRALLPFPQQQQEPIP